MKSLGVVSDDRVALQKLGDPLGDGLGALDLQEMAHPLDVHSSTCGSEERRNPAISTHSGWVSAPITDRTGLRMAAACSGPNVHPATAGSSTPKKVSASVDRLRYRAWDPLFEQRSARCPIEAAYRGHEHRERARGVAAL